MSEALSSLSIKQQNLSFYDEKLNESQKLAVKSILTNQNYKIIGPPGTGKTSTINEIILQLLSRNMKVLVCGPSNISIDNLINKYISSDFYKNSPVKFYRRGSSFKGLVEFNLKTIVNNLLKFCAKEKGEKNFDRYMAKMKRLYTEKIESETKLVFSTVFSSLKEMFKFDYVVVDEACQSSALETYLAIRHGVNFILVGDPKQLCHESRSLFELLSIKTHFLNTQYRMCDRLISFSNTSFYNNQIMSHIKTSHNLIENHPLLFVDTKSTDSVEASVNSSKINIMEANIVKKLVSCLKTNDIGIITPYSAQVSLLKDCYRKLRLRLLMDFRDEKKNLSL